MAIRWNVIDSVVPMASICDAVETKLLKICATITSSDLQIGFTVKACPKCEVTVMRFGPQTSESTVTIRYCPTCHGARKLGCTVCKGRLADAQGQCCAKCLGSGRVKCVMCDGEGRIRL
jgi:hypothetical protein